MSSQEVPSAPLRGDARPIPEAIVQALLAVAAVSLTGLAICAWGWYRAARAPVTAGDLSPEERQALVQKLVSVSPGEHRWAYFEPRIGYTLRPDAEVTAYEDTFSSNALGYRTGEPAKKPGTFRVVFVGDSWTYGMGVREEESYPRVLERLANRHAGSEQPIEAWTLALPGYSAMNYLSALDFFLERLEPDAVVICVSSNDNHSMVSVLPDGSLWSGVAEEDEFGDPHVVTYRARRFDTYRFRTRWLRTLELIRDSEQRLARLEIPLLYFFLARWEPRDVHPLVDAGGLEAPYVIAPVKLTLGQWMNPPPMGHGTAPAHERYARLVYGGLSRVLGWAPLPAEAEPIAAEVFDAPPPGEDWAETWDQVLAWGSRRALAESFQPSPDLEYETARYHDAGRLDLATGLMGRATTVLIRRAPEARWVRIAVRRLADAPSLYPLELSVSIPSPSGGSRRSVTLPADGPEVLRFALEIPDDLAARTSLDVVFVAERTVASPGVLAARSLHIESVAAAVERSG